MSKSKSRAKKLRLGVELKKNRRLPVFVIAKTNRKVSSNPRRRNWRSRKIKLKIK
ncbi:MAG: 50S ribosomal protein L39e [Candidatus Micrarchaeota archaeon]